MNIEKQKPVHRTSYVMLVILSIAITLMLNLVVERLTYQFGLKFDMTTEKIYQLSEQTINTVEQLDEPVNIYVLMERTAFASQEYYSMVYEVLNRYKNISDKLNIQYIDIYKNPGFVGRFTDANLLGQGSLIVETSKRYKFLPINEMFQVKTDTSTGVQSITGFGAEQALTSSLLFVTMEEVPKAYFVQGHDETITEGFINLLHQNNYATEPINLSLEGVPQDADLLIISSPLNDFSEKEIEAMDDYLENTSGNVLVFYGTDMPKLPKLESYFEEWGIRMEQTILIEDQRYIGNQMQLIPFLVNNSLNEKMSAYESLHLVMPYSREMRVLWTENGDRKVELMLVSSDLAYGKDYSDSSKITERINRDPDDVRGPFVLAAMSERAGGANNIDKSSRIMFFASAGMINDNLIKATNLMNKHYISHAITKVSQIHQGVSIVPKNIVSDKLIMVGNVPNIILIVLLLIPILLFVFGFVQWIRRRSL